MLSSKILAHAQIAGAIQKSLINIHSLLHSGWKQSNLQHERNFLTSEQKHFHAQWSTPETRVHFSLCGLILMRWTIYGGLTMAYVQY